MILLSISIHRKDVEFGSVAPSGKALTPTWYPNYQKVVYRLHPLTTFNAQMTEKRFSIVNNNKKSVNDVSTHGSSTQCQNGTYGSVHSKRKHILHSLPKVAPIETRLFNGLNKQYSRKKTSSPVTRTCSPIVFEYQEAEGALPAIDDESTKSGTSDLQRLFESESFALNTNIQPMNEVTISSCIHIHNFIYNIVCIFEGFCSN
jgi:hypothetical protein